MTEQRLKKLKVGKEGATELTGIQVYRSTIAPSQVSASSISAQTFTIAGLKTSDTVEVNPGVNTIGVAGAYVSAADTLTVVFVNPTAGAITPASSTWQVIATRS